MLLISIGANRSAAGYMPLDTCQSAIRPISSFPGLSLVAVSQWYETSPMPQLQLAVHSATAKPSQRSGVHDLDSEQREGSTDGLSAGAAPDILVIDDHPLMLEILHAVAREALGLAHVHIANNLEDGLALAGDYERLGLVLLDLGLPGCAGIEALTRFREQYPDPKIVVVSVSTERDTIRKAFEAGASGYIPKTARRDVIVSALRLVAAGNRYIPDQMFENSAERRRGLSDRQLDVLRLMLKGLSNREIANELNIAESTVKQHVSVIYEVLHVKTRAEAMVVAARQGYKTEG